MSNDTTPYAGTEGFAGTQTSKDRAVERAHNARERQNALLAYLGKRLGVGATVAEVKLAHYEPTPAGEGRRLPAEFLHHGTASGTLSILHRAGKIARLTETRNGARVYVLPEHVADRPTEPFRGTSERHQQRALATLRATVQTEIDTGVPLHHPMEGVGRRNALRDVLAMIDKQAGETSE